MTVRELIRQYKQRCPEGHFFDKDTMRAFGDTVENYGVRDAGTHWELYRKRPVTYMTGGQSKDSAFFHKETFRYRGVAK